MADVQARNPTSGSGFQSGLYPSSGTPSPEFLVGGHSKNAAQDHDDGEQRARPCIAGGATGQLAALNSNEQDALDDAQVDQVQASQREAEPSPAGDGLEEVAVEDQGQQEHRKDLGEHGARVTAHHADAVHGAKVPVTPKPVSEPAAGIRSRALNYLRSGAVVVGVAKRSADPTLLAPVFVAARVTGHRSPFYMVHLLDGRWTCSCKGQWDDGEECAHVASIQLVTGHPSAAALPAREPAAVSA